MTLEEKIGQMNQLSFNGNVEEMIPFIKAGKTGSLFNVVDPVQANALQRVAVEESRLGIPLLMGRDVIHGFKTVMPIPLGQAATFDPQVVEEGARRRWWRREPVWRPSRPPRRVSAGRLPP